MNKKILFTLVAAIFSLSLYAQIITERIVPTPSGKTVFQSSFNKKDYEERSHANGVKTYTKKRNASPTLRASEDEVTLTIRFEYDPELYIPLCVGYMNEVFTLDVLDKEESDILELSIPKGIYDFFCISDNIENYRRGYSYIIKEQVEVNENLTLVMNCADAKNRIVTKTYNTNGELMEPGTLNEDWTAVVGGNINDMVAEFSIIKNSMIYPFVTTISGNWQLKYTADEDVPFNFYISDISDRFTVAQNRISVDKNENFYFNKYVSSDIHSSLTIENNPENYVAHKEKFQISPVGKNTEKHYLAFSAEYSWNGVLGSFGWKGSIPKECNNGEVGIFYLDNPVTDISHPQGYDLFVSTGITDQTKTNTYDYTLSPPLVLGPDNELIYSSYPGANSENTIFLWTSTHMQYLPFHSRFSFSPDENEDIQLGNNAPVMSLSFINYYDEYYQSDIYSIEGKYIGRYGENKASDYDSTFVIAKQNGTEFFSGKYDDFDSSTLLQQLPPDGILDIAYTNLNVEVDDLPGKNHTRILLDQSKEDKTPPTVQMLQFRNTAGQVTDRFQSAEEGVARLAAGDFDFNADYWYFSYREDATIHFSYAPYNTENWTELPLTRYPEFFVMPAFGDYYEASLAPVIQSGATKWYDVKIVCTDAAGNSQEQILSPAFQIDEGAPIMATNLEERKSYIYENTLYIDSPSAESIEVYSLVGSKILSTKKGSGQKTIDVSYLPKGVYIIKGNSGQCNRVLKK